MQRGRPMEGLEDLRKACMLDRDSPIPIANLGYGLFKVAALTQSNEMIAEADKLFKEGIETFPKSALLHSTYGSVSDVMLLYINVTPLFLYL